MPKDMREHVLRLALDAVDNFPNDFDKEKFIRREMKAEFGREWVVEANPLKRNAPLHLYDHMIYFRVGKSVFIVSNKKEPASCCLFCCV